jgi:UDP-GlcNAc3NAcA epimerase
MRFLKMTTIVGARPQFIKVAAVSRAINRHNAAYPDQAIREMLIHTGQHYDYEMSAVFFRELGLPEPAHHLGVGAGPHGAQTGEMLKRVETVLLEERPDLVLVYGDTNSTLAGALTAAKLHLPVAHVEAGLRSFNRQMPEEVNRILTDQLATWLFCPSEQAVQNLVREGIQENIHLIGDVMYDVLLWHLPLAQQHIEFLKELDLQPGDYALATVHRAENTDDDRRLTAIFAALERLAEDGLPVILPLHPRTRKALSSLGFSPKGVKMAPPISYQEMLCLEANARVILTDSGGVQKEAYWLGVPCVTLREETEWVETVEAGWNVLAGCDPDQIVEVARNARPGNDQSPLYGDGHAAEHVVSILLRFTEVSLHKNPGSLAAEGRLVN